MCFRSSFPTVPASLHPTGSQGLLGCRQILKELLLQGFNRTRRHQRHSLSSQQNSAEMQKRILSLPKQNTGFSSCLCMALRGTVLKPRSSHTFPLFTIIILPIILQNSSIFNRLTRVLLSWTLLTSP